MIFVNEVEREAWVQFVRVQLRRDVPWDEIASIADSLVHELRTRNETLQVRDNQWEEIRLREVNRASEALSSLFPKTKEPENA